MITLYNTLTRQKSAFQPLDTQHVRMYVCGPTVYDTPHIGNARPVVVFDVLYRLLKAVYPKVSYVRNITDIDDKINARAAHEGITIQNLTNRTIEHYARDMHALNALPPTKEPRATQHITHIIHMIKQLIQKGYAYENDGHVLFRTGAYKKYGHLSNRTMESLMEGARIAIESYKESGHDFVLWKPSHAAAQEPGWDSPFGFGRPGWHIECSAMSSYYLGETFDIHGGGIDLVFPHHENEIAQSCAFHGHDTMARYWLHNGHVMVNGAKMSKSLGNFTTVETLLKDYEGVVVRLALLHTHYRQPIDFQNSILKNAEKALEKWRRLLRSYISAHGKEDLQNTASFFQTHAAHSHPSRSFAKDFWSALCDDMNTPLCLTHMHAMARAYHSAADDAQKHLGSALWHAGSVLGLWAHPKDLKVRASTTPVHASALTPQEIEALLEQRTNARNNKDFKESDRIRDLLASHGVRIVDTPEGPQWILD